MHYTHDATCLTTLSHRPCIQLGASVSHVVECIVFGNEVDRLLASLVLMSWHACSWEAMCYIEILVRLAGLTGRTAGKVTSTKRMWEWFWMMSFLAVELDQTLRGYEQTLSESNMVHDHERRPSIMRSWSAKPSSLLLQQTNYLPAGNSLSTFFTSRSPSFPR